MAGACLRGVSLCMKSRLWRLQFLLAEIIPDQTDCDQGLFKAILLETICNDNFYGDNVATIRNNVATMLQRCVALKIVVANSPM